MFTFPKVSAFLDFGGFSELPTFLFMVLAWDGELPEVKAAQDDIVALPIQHNFPNDLEMVWHVSLKFSLLRKLNTAEFPCAEPGSANVSFHRFSAKQSKLY